MRRNIILGSDRMSAAYLRDHWADVRSKLYDIMGRFEDRDLDFRPYASAWTVRELMLHVGHEEYGEVQHGITRELPEWPAEFDVAAYPSVASIQAKLGEVHARTMSLMGGLDDAAFGRTVETPWGAKDSLRALLGHVLEHEIHHRAELSLILGMLGRQGLDA
jgi:uncharacterized damage-inducible protein DinB